jgi:two-component system LytT family response regulator
MERVIVIDDKYCKKEIDALLIKYKKSVKLDMETNSMVRNMAQAQESFPELNREERRVLINGSNSSVLVKLKDIVRCQSNRNYTELHLQNGNKLTVSRPLKQFAELALFSDFARVHVSHLVNINYIDRFNKADGGSLLLLNGTRLPVSKRRRDEWIRKMEIV